MVGSIDAEGMYFAGAFSVQRHRQENIEKLQEMVRRLLQIYREENRGRLPAQIIYFRDGVAETHYSQVPFE